MRLRIDEYLRVRKSLRSVRDLGKFGYPRGTLHSILLQKRIESVKRKYRGFAERVGEIVEFWREHGRFPRWLTLPPVMKVRLLMKGLGFSAKAINRMLHNPKEIDDEKLRRIVEKAVSVDYVYSPLATKLQAAKGKLGERLLQTLLDTMGFDYRTEEELRGSFSKTPDAYFDEPVEVDGRRVRWIESKAMFGDPLTHEFFERKQYSKYRRLFGEGIVVYWFGCVEGIDAYTGDELGVNADNMLRMRVYASGEQSDDPFDEALKAIDAYSRGEEATVSVAAARLLKNMGFEVVYL